MSLVIAFVALDIVVWSQSNMDIAKAYAEDVSRVFCSSAGKVLRKCQLIEIEQRNLRQSGTATSDMVYDFMVDMSASGEGESHVPAWWARRLTCPPGKILAEHIVEPRGMRSSASAVRCLDEHFPKASAVLKVSCSQVFACSSFMQIMLQDILCCWWHLLTSIGMPY